MWGWGLCQYRGVVATEGRAWGAQYYALTLLQGLQCGSHAGPRLGARYNVLTLIQGLQCGRHAGCAVCDVATLAKLCS